MLKSVLYYLLLCGTTVRLIDIIFLLTKGNISLPLPVMLMTSAMILFGIVLLVKKLFGNIRVKHYMVFYAIQTAMIIFNIAYIAVAYPLHVSLAETVLIGSFLDILVNLCVVYACVRQSRNVYAPSIRVIGESRIGNV